MLSGSVSASVTFSFKPSSALASGKWVKVFTGESGIYEIPYSRLREMGFSNPSKVGVYGSGAAPKSLSFTDRNGTPLVTDDLNPVAVYHRDDKLIFYVQGPTDISFTGTYFDRKDINLYTKRGAYFLTDKDSEPLRMSTFTPSNGSKKEYKSGMDYIVHERDLFHNTTSTGQLYWGESLIDTTLYSWPVEIPYVDLSRKATMICKIYASPASSGNVSFGVMNSEGNCTYRIQPPAEKVFRTQSVTTANPSLRSNRSMVFVECDNPSGSFINIDYWTFSYPKLLPDFTNPNSGNQERIFITPQSLEQGLLPFNTPKQLISFDVSNPEKPYILASDREGDILSAYFQPKTSCNQIIVCDPDREQMTISGYEPVDNTDIHSLASEGADMLIVTTDRYLNHARRLADLHDRYNQTKAVVVRLKDVYNEFSQGVPDPIAIRGVVKDFYDNGSRKLKNLLLFGPVYGDVRAMEAEGNAEENMIAFQGTLVTIEGAAPNVMDIYGYTSDYINTGSLADNTMEVGVGTLPLYSEADAERCIRKTERYLTDDRKAIYVNELFSVGGTGEDHTHELQASMLVDSILYKTGNLPMECVTPVLAIDAFGLKEARRKFIDNLTRGSLFTWYHGHASYYLLNQERGFFTNADIPQMRNEHLGFLFVGGCDLSGTDWKRRGLGENFVTGTDHGMAGIIMSPRTSWSGQNFKLATNLCRALFNQRGTSTRKRVETPTIGEVYADTKSPSKESNDLNYIYIGDPGLKIPVPLARISTGPLKSAAPGAPVSLKGQITDLDGNPIKDFNGQIMAKIMAPAVTLTSADYQTGTINEKPWKGMEIKYVDDRQGIFEGTVKDGEFTLDVLLPTNADTWSGQELPIYLSAYDHSVFAGAADKTSVFVLSQSASDQRDRTAPSLMVTYDPEAMAIRGSLSDNLGSAPGAVEATIDSDRLAVIDLSGSAIRASRQFMVPAHHLNPGSHSATLTAVDCAGNPTEMKINFTVPEWKPAISIALESAIVKESLEFSLPGLPAGEFEITIMDEANHTVGRRLIDRNHLSWDCRNSEGNPLSTGLYRMRVAGAQSSNAHLCSAWKYFAVIE